MKVNTNEQKNSGNKLRLCKETIRELRNSNLKQAAGGRETKSCLTCTAFCTTKAA